MRLLKTHPVLSIANDFFIDSPLPSNITYLWNFGSLLGLCLVLQIVTGVTLGMHYAPSTSLAFVSVEHIMRDVFYGWLIRYAHANGASFFFICVYIHMARGLYFNSYTKPRILLWSVGVVIFLIMMATAFLGYVLPWGQMSFWGATVITNLLSAIPYIGPKLVEFVWGGFSVDNATLNRFFSLHYLLPFILIALVGVHFIALHQHGFKGPKFIEKLSFILPNIRSNKRIGPHDREIYDFLFGTLLGDCHGERLKSGGVRFRFKQSEKKKEYLFYLYDFLLKRGYVNKNLPSFIKDKFGNSYIFSTYTYSNLLWFYKIFYKNKIKKVPELEYLKLFLSPLALAIWIQDDGTYHGSGLRIGTNSFNKDDCLLLIKVLKLKFDLNCTLHKNKDQFQIYIKKESMSKLILLVKEYFHYSMFYKLGIK